MNTMTVSEVSKTFGISARMLRYYEKVGLISSSRKDDYAYRIYDEENIRRLQQIMLFRKLRLPLKHIAVILDDSEQSEALELLRQNISELNDEINALETIRKILGVFIDRLDESIKRKVRLDLIGDGELYGIADALSLPKDNLKKEFTMNDLNEANRTVTRLTDRDVRIMYIPPLTVASIHTVSDSPEMDNLVALRKFIRDTGLCEKKRDFRLIGFNNETPNCHGYEHWITVPEDMELPAPFVKKHFSGGLYGAHMIPIGQFEDWKLLYQWAIRNDEYEVDWRAPESVNGGMLEEHLNFINIYDNDAETLDKMLQLDLLIPIRKKVGVR